MLGSVSISYSFHTTQKKTLFVTLWCQNIGFLISLGKSYFRRPSCVFLDSHQLKNIPRHPEIWYISFLIFPKCSNLSTQTSQSFGRYSCNIYHFNVKAEKFMNDISASDHVVTVITAFSGYLWLRWPLQMFRSYCNSHTNFIVTISTCCSNQSNCNSHMNIVAGYRPMCITARRTIFTWKKLYWGTSLSRPQYLL